MEKKWRKVRPPNPEILTAFKTESGHTFTHEYYFDPAGVARWASNDSAISLSVAKEYGIQVNRSVQQNAVSLEAEEFLNAVSKQQKERVYTEEELSEMRAVFGPGKELIAFPSGRKIKL